MTTEAESKALEVAANDIIGIDSLTAAQLKERVDTLLREIGENEWQLGKKFVQLGNSLLKVRTTRAWENWRFASFGAYIDSIRGEINRGRTQLYSTISVAEKLLPIVGEEKLEQMGITKANELKKSTNDGKTPSEELVNKALDPKVGVQELRAEVFRETKQPETDRGVYWDLGGFFVTQDERDEIKRAFDVATTVLNIKPDTPEHIKRKEITIAMCREFLSTYEKPVNDEDDVVEVEADQILGQPIEPEYLESNG
jgi:hypothetical protein